MVVKQIYSVVNSVATQAMGGAAPAVTDLTGLIALGNTVLSSDTSKDKFLNALVDRIGKTIFQQKVYTSKKFGLVMDSLTYGAAIEKTYVEPEAATQNDAWSIAEGGELGPGTIHLPTVRVKIFENHDTWKYTVCVPDYQMNTAFLSEQNMVSFVNSIYSAIETSMNLALENMERMCVANFIGEKLDYQKANPTSGNHAINVLKKYNDAMGTALTAAKCNLDRDFHRFACQYIKTVFDKFENITEIFNTEGYKRFTDKENLEVIFLSEFAAANATYLESDTFHNELVKLPGYNTVNFWQGVGAHGDFADTSTINIDTSSGKTVDQSGIICFAFDRDALGVMFDQRVTKSYVDPDKDLTKIWEKATMGYFNDLSENAVVFYVADESGH